MSVPLTIIIVEKTSILKTLSIKDFKIEELYKKCGFKKSNNFIKQCEWNIKFDGKKIYIEVYGKTEGRPNSENKYDFPPPFENLLFYGNCVILTYIKKTDGTKIYTNLTIQLWKQYHDKLFGGFDDLSSTAIEDENEEDELTHISKDKKTKEGYLKDGFVVDGSSDIEENSDNEDFDNIESFEENIDDELGSELSEESYDFTPPPPI